jgi:hypothetical protein
VRTSRIARAGAGPVAGTAATALARTEVSGVRR